MKEQATISNLVLGSEGFVGKPFCEHLERLGERVARFDIQRGAHEDARCARLPMEGIDRVYFLAWEVGGAKYLYRDDVQFRQLDWNLQLLLNVMPQLRESGVPFLFVSSQLAEERDTVYGVTKRLGEVWTHLLNGVRVRLWNVYGGYEDQTERSHVVADFVHQALATGRIEMMTNGEEIRQFIHVDDVCDAFHLALSGRLGGIYDVTTFEWVSVRSMAQLIADLTGAKVVPGTRVGLTPVTPMVGKVPDWKPNLTLREGLSKMVDLYRRRRREGLPIP
jgi:nucleoside-diphosphate-sugar epimerase